MRVGFDVSKIFGPPDGVARYSVSLLQALAEEAEERGGTPALHLYSLGAEADSAAWKALLDELPRNVRKGPGRWPRRRDLDLFHIPSFSDPACFDGPAVFTIHDLTFLTHPEFHVPDNRNQCLLGTLRAVSRQATILAVSEATAKEVRKWFVLPEDRLRVVYEAASPVFVAFDGAQLTAARERLAARFGLEGQFVLSVGSLEPRKNIARLVEAYAGLDQNLQENTPLVLVGGSSWKEDAAFGGPWPGFVRRLGAVEEEDLIALYNVAVVVAYPSLVEGFGLPVVEAMACGTPVLTSNTSSLAEVGGDAALCVDPTDVAAIRGGLAALLGDADLRRHYRRAGFVRAAGFSWRTAAKEVIGIYGGMVDAG
ncbi:MAG: glycosyltransferase family 1 protein [Acidobacteria bacterium]|nr:glycosyltransferase family 1 protein [Acidobacteriota bacterium]MCY3964505.1 glycosyltransferase family 1 protein [Acidobacteriota bacterium]